MAVSPDPIHVVAGILRDADGRVLLAERPAGKHLAGLWEFPGGKLEPGEDRITGLTRELHEEIGIEVDEARPLIAVPHRYPGKSVLLDVFEVPRWRGTPHPREGQRLAWVESVQIARVPMPEADRPVLVAMELPDRYLITLPSMPADAAAVLAGIARALDAGIRMIQLRQHDWPYPRLAEVARAARDLCHAVGARLLINADCRLAAVLGLDGVHLPARAAAGLSRRPLPNDRRVAVSCHDADELAHAVHIGADFVTLSPVRATPGHPHAAPLGWRRFAALVADCPLPVYALGGVAPADIAAARAAGAQGIAAIRGLHP